MQLFDNAFSPFARKVRLVLQHKELEFEELDGLDLSNRERLEAVNGRVEVPTLLDGDACVVNSADIIAYLEHKYPRSPSVYPADPTLRAQARAWERCSDTVVDAILINLSYWGWAVRPDSMPAGLLERAQQDMSRIYDALEQELEGREFLLGDVTVADYAFWPHISSVRMLNVNFSPEKHPNVLGWFKRLRAHPLCAADLERTKRYIANPASLNVERNRIFWRGDRIEWMLAAGQHRWFHREVEEDRVIWPGLGIPKPLPR